MKKIINYFIDHCIFICTMLIGGFLLGITLSYGFGFDQGNLHYIAWRWLDGDWPYINAWDTSFFGGYLPHLLAIVFGGHTPISFRILDLIVQLFSIFLIFRISKELDGERAGMIAAILFSVDYVAAGYYQTGQRDGFIIPLILLFLYLVVKDTPSKTKRVLLCGICMGISIIFRPTYILLAFVGGILLFWREQRRNRFTLMLLYGVMCFSPVIIFTCIYILRGEFHELQDLVNYLSVVYPQIESQSSLDVLWSFFRYTSHWVLVGIILFIIRMAITRHSFIAFARFFIIFSAIVLVRFLESKTYFYQFWPYLAFVSILAGIGWQFGFSALSSFLAKKSWGRLISPLLIVTFLPLIYLTNQIVLSATKDLFLELQAGKGQFTSDANWVKGRDDFAELVSYLKQHTQPTDKIQLWGPPMGIYYATQRSAPSRFADPKSLICSGFKLYTECEREDTIPEQSRWAKELLDSIHENKPHYIVAHFEQDRIQSEAIYAMAPDFPMLRSIMMRDYEFETEVGYWSVFHRVDE